MKHLFFLFLVCAFLLSGCKDEVQYSLKLGAIHESDFFYSLDVDYPVLTSSNSNNQSVADFNREIATFLSMNIDRYRADSSLVMMKQDVEQSNSGARYSKQIEHDLFFVYNGLYSIRFTVYEYALGAHGNSHYNAFNFDVVNGRRMSSGDILDRSTEEKKQALVDILNLFLENPHDCFTLTEKELESNIEMLNFTANELIFSFAHYELGPYACGTVELRVPLEQLESRGLLQETFLKQLTGVNYEQ